jgi:hypothetical protein
MTIAKNSADPNINTRGLKIGIVKLSTIAPITPPRIDAVTAAPMALPASPFLAIGKPSIIVAVLPEVPGEPISMQVTHPAVQVIAAMLKIKAIAFPGSNIKIKGSSKASPVTPSRPGSIPKNIPKTLPIINIKTYEGVIVIINIRPPLNIKDLVNCTEGNL